MLHKLALGIMAQTGACKHTYKMLSERPSRMMSGGPSVRMSGCLSMISRCLTVIESESPSMMVFEGQSIRMFQRLSVMMSVGPSMRMFGRLSMMMSESASVMMFRWFAVMMSGAPLMRMFGRLSMMMSESPSMMMFGSLSVKFYERSSKKISGHNNEDFQEKKLDSEGNLGTRFKQDIQVAQDSCEKQKKEDFHAVTVYETSLSKGYTGLENQGATCYLNTVLQILFMTEEFREAVGKHKPKPHNCNSNCNCNINNHIAQLFERLKSGERTTATTEGITSELKINVHKQEDAAKCLQKILNKVDPEIVKKIFQGTKVDKTICKTPAKPHEPLTQVKTFFIISISLESQDHVNMQSCFESYFAPIIMSGEDQQIYCKECKMMMDTEIICSLRSVPSVLVLHLERFELDYDTMCCVKNESTVEIHPQLLVKDEDGVNHTYDLYAIANHDGSLNSGHYYADIRSFEDQQWYQFNDSTVQTMCDLDKPLLSDEAYLLLYKKSAVASTASQSQTAEDEPNIMEEETYSKCEKDETITDIKVDLESHFNSSLAEQQESTNTSACDECLDVPESTVVTTDHQHPSSLSENSDHDSETNASAQQIVSDEKSQSLMCTNDVPNTSEIVNIRKNIINMYETKSSFCIVFSLVICIIIIMIFFSVCR